MWLCALVIGKRTKHRPLTHWKPIIASTREDFLQEFEPYVNKTESGKKARNGSTKIQLITLVFKF